MITPWLDRSGRLSPFKTLVFGALFVPAAWTGLAYVMGELGPRPINAATHEIGLWTIRLLFTSLAITPVRQILQWPHLVLVRRMIGVATFFYASLHLCIYVMDQAFDLEKVVSEIALRFYLTLGFTALLMLTALAATSTDGAVRWLGGKRWRRLHQLVYVVGVLALIHFFYQSKVNVDEAMWMSGLFAWLMGYRVMAWLCGNKSHVPLWALFVLALASTLAMALGEASYYWIKLDVDPMRVLDANFTFMIGIRPSWITLSAGTLAALIGAIRAYFAQRPVRPRLQPA
ncbi:MAG TPA: protein-methionine-sulfoxide reductase heme-binding subunit MsrQ [Alphaproteobacteria bacterium]|nr:protein-methionine-sulfoxide reductase heme-binding subunit MsrQ [Alphaproteobacteria bacterium]